MRETTNNKPIHVLRRRGVKISVFENRSGDTIFHKITIQKIYRDESGAWKTTTSYGRDDAPIISHLTDQAWEWILDREEQGKQSQSLTDVQSSSQSFGYSTTKTHTGNRQPNEGDQP